MLKSLLNKSLLELLGISILYLIFTGVLGFLTLGIIGINGEYWSRETRPLTLDGFPTYYSCGLLPMFSYAEILANFNGTEYLIVWPTETCLGFIHPKSIKQKFKIALENSKEKAFLFTYVTAKISEEDNIAFIEPPSLMIPGFFFTFLVLTLPPMIGVWMAILVNGFRAIRMRVMHNSF